ncbi:MAG TPA: COP23 domain-containing protein [Allocoleopsis sp.]
MKTQSLINLLSIAALSIANIGLIPAVTQAQVPPIEEPPPVEEPNVDKPPVEPKPENPEVKNEPEAKGSAICSNLTTVIQQGESSAVLFTWKTNYFGSDYTPQKRCEIVSSKLNSLIEANNGQFGGIKFTNGIVNNYPVICSPKEGEASCNQNNILFTLKPENRAKAQEIIRLLEDPNSVGTVGSINEARRLKVDLGKWAKRNLRASKSPKIKPQIKPQIKPKVKPSKPIFK